ncbi:predicted protein [Nematostella vectensis]|uniref:Gelsolin-like domain-containing protein n=1 Tax=Nematostella vectensis TaxID=45351 RepID=A7RGV0_NEMVE|nr:predicted protein [Nematostella vectensis]|eukprot:XP_001641298.1 predicted protein [Nematostella vectensis]
MSGLRKQKQPEWKDTNLALFGSDIEKNVKREAAATEIAWKNAGTREGLQIWRIEKFKVKVWSREDYGSFYDGDSYIILNTYKESGEDELKYDVHFWIGKDSTQDEYGTAAYKTVELDIHLNDKPIQHREVQGFESKLFKSYFKSLTILKGGVDSGFRHVKPQEYKPRLLRVRGTTVSNCVVEEVLLARSSLCSEDVFILDKGLNLYLWVGVKCDKDEKFRGMQEILKIKSERNGKPKSEVNDESSMKPDDDFYKLLPNVSKDCEDSSFPKGDYDSFEPELYRISDASGKIQKTQIKKGRISRKDFDEQDVFLFDTGRHLFVYTGNKASIDERRLALQIGHNHLMRTDHPFAAISTVYHGREPGEFLEALAH